jgi:hypothetical protein
MQFLVLRIGTRLARLLQLAAKFAWYDVII